MFAVTSISPLSCIGFLISAFVDTQGEKFVLKIEKLRLTILSR